MRQHLILALLWAMIGLIACQPPCAQSCSDDTLQMVGKSGEILIMASGAIYEVLPGDEIDSSLWLPPSTVVICARSFVSRDGRTLSYYEIINTDEKEKVGATRLR
jgi:hypothetical protein